MRYNTIVFDFDGTLAYTCEDVWRSVDYAAAAIGCSVPVTFRSSAKNLALPKEEIFAALLPAPVPGLFAQFAETLNHHYLHQNPFATTTLYPGIESLLQRLTAENRTLYVVTNKLYSSMDMLMRRGGWTGYFKGWYSPDGPGDWQFTKPQLLAHLVSAGVFRPEESLYIGDSPGDVLAARFVGMPVLGVEYGDGDEAELLALKPAYSAASVQELAALLETL